MIEKMNAEKLINEKFDCQHIEYESKESWTH